MIRLFFLVLLLLHYSCTTSEKGISDGTREKLQKTIPYVLKLQKVHRTSRAPASLLSSCKELFSHFGYSRKKIKENSFIQADLDDATFKIKYEEEMKKTNDLFHFQVENSDRAVEINKDTLRYFKLPVKSNSANRVESLSKSQVDRVYHAVKDHPVASQCHLRKYDPAGDMGFCFGRAMTAHLELLASGVQKDKIRKIWALGKMKTNSTKWRYHVCTVVKARDGTWWTVDPIFSRPVQVEDWMDEMKKMDTNDKLMFLTTNSSRFSPNRVDKYERGHLGLSEFNEYFQELLKSYRENEGPFNGMVFRPAP